MATDKPTDTPRSGAPESLHQQTLHAIYTLLRQIGRAHLDPRPSEAPRQADR